MSDDQGSAWRLGSAAGVHRSMHVRAIAGATLALAASAAIGAERAIDKEVVVAAPIESVWQAWTTRAGIRTFFAPDAEIDARVGGAFHIHINPFAEPGMKGADDMRYMALQRPTMLSFDWNAPPSLPEVRAQRTFVVVRLAPVDAQSTRVTLHHTGWGSGVVVINPPYTLHDQLATVLPFLVEALGQYDGANYLLEQRAA